MLLFCPIQKAQPAGSTRRLRKGGCLIRAWVRGDGRSPGPRYWRRRPHCRFPAGPAGPGFPAWTAAFQPGQQVPDFPHGHGTHLFRGDGGVQSVQFQVGPVLAAGEPQVVGPLQFLRQGGVAAGVLMAGGAAFQGRKHPAGLLVFGAHHRDVHGPAPGQQRCNLGVGQDGLHRLGVGVEPDIQGLGQGLAVLVPAFHPHDPVKAVDRQLDGGVDVDADPGGGEKVEPVTSGQQHQQAGCRRQNLGQPADRGQPGPGLGGHKGPGPGFQGRVRVNLAEGLPNVILHRRHLPGYPGASGGSGSAGCKPC